MFSESSREPLQRQLYRSYATVVRLQQSRIEKAYSEPMRTPSASERRIVGSKTPSGERIEIPRIVWMYWDDPDLPPLVQGILRRVQESSPNFEVRMLNRHSVQDYIPDIASWRDDLPQANRANLIRLQLLRDFGGIWLDATTIPGEDLEWTRIWAAQEDLGLVAFYNRSHSSQAIHPVVETWFLAAGPGNPFITKWLDLLAVTRTRPKAELYQELMNFESSRQLAAVIQDPFYRIVYLVCQRVFDVLDVPRMGLVAADDEAFYAFGSARHSWEVAMNLLVRPDFERPPLVSKFTKRERLIIDSFQRQKVISRRSMIGRILDEVN